MAEQDRCEYKGYRPIKLSNNTFTKLVYSMIKKNICIYKQNLNTYNI